MLEIKTPVESVFGLFFTPKVKVRGILSPNSLPKATENGDERLIRLKTLDFTVTLEKNRAMCSL